MVSTDLYFLFVNLSIWRIPSLTQRQELRSPCHVVWTTACFLTLLPSLPPISHVCQSVRGQRGSREKQRWFPRIVLFGFVWSMERDSFGISLSRPMSFPCDSHTTSGCCRELLDLYTVSVGSSFWIIWQMNYFQACPSETEFYDEPMCSLAVIAPACAWHLKRSMNRVNGEFCAFCWRTVSLKLSPF